jgi:leucyl aminopeptidase (aminopeptidase T)
METTAKTAPKKGRAKPDLTLADLAEKYIKHLEEAGKSPGTVFSYTAELKLAIKELGAETTLASITPEMVQAFFDSKAVTTLRASGRKKAQPSIDKTRRVLRLALVWAVEKKLIKSAPIPEQKKS